MSKSSAALLNIKNLSIKFDKFEAVKNISFSVNKNEITALVGESGSGKSVSANSILKLLSSANINGEILFNNEDINFKNEKNLQQIRGKDIGIVFQEPMVSLNPLHRVKKQVMEAILTHNKISKKEALKQTQILFKEVGLSKEKLNSFPHQLSGGQKQRVCIALALSNNPKLLIADEITTSLDLTVQKQIIELLKNLKKKFKMAILFISHDISLVSKIADKIYVMSQGQIVESGNTIDIINNPKHPYTKQLIDASKFLEQETKNNYHSDILGHYERSENSHPQKKQMRCFANAQHNNNCVIASEAWQSSLLLCHPKQSEESHQLNKTNNIILSVKNLNVVINKKQILHNISFNVKKSTTLGIIGESGSGKTTIGQAILRLIESSGEIKYNDGTKIYTLNNMNYRNLKPLKKDLQIVFQDPYSSLNPKIMIKDIIKEGLIVQNIGTKTNHNQMVKNILDEVNLPINSLNKYPHEFSGGQRQRIAIARALILKPKVLVLDEPTSSLDVTIQKQILKLLRTVQSEHNLTYIFITHDLKVIRYMSDEILVLKDGKIVEFDVSYNIFKNPQNEYTKNLINEIY